MYTGQDVQFCRRARAWRPHAQKQGTGRPGPRRYRSARGAGFCRAKTAQDIRLGLCWSTACPLGSNRLPSGLQSAVLWGPIGCPLGPNRWARPPGKSIQGNPAAGPSFRAPIAGWDRAPIAGWGRGRAVAGRGWWRGGASSGLTPGHGRQAGLQGAVASSRRIAGWDRRADPGRGGRCRRAFGGASVVGHRGTTGAGRSVLAPACPKTATIRGIRRRVARPGPPGGRSGRPGG